MNIQWRPKFGLQFLLAVGVAIALLIGMVNILTKKTVIPSLQPNTYKIVGFKRWRGQYYGGDPSEISRDSLYLLEIGSPDQYFVQLHYYDWETKKKVSTELPAGVQECILQYMPDNPGIFAFNLRRPGECYLSAKSPSIVKHEWDSYDVVMEKIAGRAVLAITLFYKQSGTGKVPVDAFLYVSEDEIKGICDAHQVGCIWVTLEPVVTQ
jgi:hypothetical protein